MTHRNMTARTASHSRREQGFSLVELMVVITILGLLASIVGTAVFNKLKKAKRSTAKQQMLQFENGIKLYRMDHSSLPDSLDELFGEDAQLDGDGPPDDPWNNPYAYEKLSRSEFALTCYGADGVEGGEGEDEDITQDDLRGNNKDDGE